VDELLTEEHKLIRDTARKHVSKHLKPIIEERFEKATFSRTSSPAWRRSVPSGLSCPWNTAAWAWTRSATA
jgi:hypothetical protein